MAKFHRKIAVFGSTGSIGRSALEVVAAARGKLEVVALSAHGRLTELCEQARKLLPAYVVATDEAAAERFDWSELPGNTKLLVGHSGLEEVVRLREIDIVLAAIVGSAGL